MKAKRHLLLLLIISLLGSCRSNDRSGVSFEFNNFFGEKDLAKNETLIPSDYVRWVQESDNGLIHKKTIGDLDFSLQYKPYDYIISMEERSDSIRASIQKEKLVELEGMEYYDFKIKLNSENGELLKHNLKSTDEYKKRVEYFAFTMQNDIWMVDGNDSIPCSLFHFERGYDAAPYSTFLIGFPIRAIKNSNAEKTFVYYDKNFDKGIIKFTLDKNKLVNIPKLKTI